MLKKRFAVEPALLLSVAALLGFSCLATRAHAQPVGNQPLHFQVSAATQRLEMIVNTTRILTLNHDVPRLLVQNPDIIRAIPLSPNRIQVTALRPGVTALNVWDDNNQVQAIDVRVFGDVRALEETLKREFPDVTVQVRTLETSLLLTGHIPNSEDVPRIVEIAREYF
ncbi:MAG: pilus assembly protein N-terminal domain-containing protein, partial [Planctomycetes bacterium]|nr:pilus assembly protein N-terminal domain-containing protein [Planctomycetota bacterium]